MKIARILSLTAVLTSALTLPMAQAAAKPAANGVIHVIDTVVLPK